jgi:gluconate 2-dehydrogenase gamma chain
MSQDSTNVSRRGLFHILGAASATAAFAETQAHLPAPAHAGSTAAVVKVFERRIFDVRQFETLRVVSDLIIPADSQSPAASAALVPEFIDDWIVFRAEQDGHDRLKAEVVGGLVWLDRESNRLFQKDFAKAAPDQQKQILDRIAWPARANKEDSQYAEFFSTLRDLVVSGYFSSKPGVAYLPYLGNTVVAEWKGCDPKVWATIEQRLQGGYTGLINASNQRGASEGSDSN